MRRDALRPACRPGEECPVERAFFDAYVEDARLSFSFCTAWLTEHEFEETIHELAIVSLQKQRLSSLIAQEGITRPKTHPVSGVVYGVESALGVGRYCTAIDNKFNDLMWSLLQDPREADDANAEEPVRM